MKWFFPWWGRGGNTGPTNYIGIGAEGSDAIGKVPVKNENSITHVKARPCSTHLQPQDSKTGVGDTRADIQSSLSASLAKLAGFTELLIH